MKRFVLLNTQKWAEHIPTRCVDIAIHSMMLFLQIESCYPWREHASDDICCTSNSLTISGFKKSTIYCIPLLTRLRLMYWRCAEGVLGWLLSLLKPRLALLWQSSREQEEKCPHRSAPRTAPPSSTPSTKNRSISGPAWKAHLHCDIHSCITSKVG